MRALIALLAVAALVLLGWIGSFDILWDLAHGEIVIDQLVLADWLPVAVVVFALLGAVLVFFSPLAALFCFVLAAAAGAYGAYATDIISVALWGGGGLLFVLLCLAAHFRRRVRRPRGKVVFRGTTTPVALVLAYLEAGCTVNEVLADFSQLEREAVEQVAHLLELRARPEDVLAEDDDT